MKIKNRDNLTEALYISDKRTKYLEMSCIEKFRESESVAEFFKKISEDEQYREEERFLMCFFLGGAMEGVKK